MSESNKIRRINETEEIELTRDGQNIYIANKGTVNIYGPSGEDSKSLKSAEKEQKSEEAGVGCFAFVLALTMTIAFMAVLIFLATKFWKFSLVVFAVLVIIAILMPSEK